MYTLEYKDGVCIYKDTMLGIELRLPEANCAGMVQTRQLAAIDEVSAKRRLPSLFPAKLCMR